VKRVEQLARQQAAANYDRERIDGFWFTILHELARQWLVDPKRP
jgi:hypothetical protein